jgi:hypothetical protein
MLKEVYNNLFKVVFCCPQPKTDVPLLLLSIKIGFAGILKVEQSIERGGWFCGLV